MSSGLLLHGVRRNIGRDPVTIAITRVTRTPASTTGGASNVTTQDQAVVRLVPGEQAVRDLMAMGVDFEELDRSWLMLAPPEATLRTGELVSETFTAPQGEFRIRKVVPLRLYNLVSGYQCIVELVAKGG